MPLAAAGMASFSGMNGNASESIPPDLILALRRAQRIVVFTGAGVSAESGIPTFRDALTGLWERFDAQDLATPEAFVHDPELVWGWYEWRRMLVQRTQPNSAHRAIAELARRVPQFTVVTQNVDDLHERAGSTGVLHLHGSLQTARCIACGTAHVFAVGIPDEPEGGRRLRPPLCARCGGLIRPGVVWFGESLPEDVLAGAFAAARACDLLLAIGTSGLVQPAARIPALARQAGARVVQVNPAPTALDDDCTWSLRGAAGVILPQLLASASMLPNAPVRGGQCAADQGRAGP